VKPVSGSPPLSISAIKSLPQHISFRIISLQDY